MAFDPNDPADIAIRDAAVQAALTPVRTETAAKLAELAQSLNAEKARADGLAGQLATTQAAADKALADYDAAKTAGDSTAAELATLKAAAQTAAAAADKTLIESLPEAVRKLAPAGLAGEALAAWVTNAKAAVSLAPTGLGGGTGTAEVPTETMLTWASSMGLADVTDKSKIIFAYNKIGPGRKIAAANA